MITAKAKKGMAMTSAEEYGANGTPMLMVGSIK